MEDVLPKVHVLRTAVNESQYPGIDVQVRTFGSSCYF